MAVVQLKIPEVDTEAPTTDVITDGEFVVVSIQIWEEGLGSFELAKLEIHHSVAARIGAAAISIKHKLREAADDTTQ